MKHAAKSEAWPPRRKAEIILAKLEPTLPTPNDHSVNNKSQALAYAWLHSLLPVEFNSSSRGSSNTFFSKHLPLHANAADRLGIRHIPDPHFRPLLNGNCFGFMWERQKEFLYNDAMCPEFAHRTR